MWRVCPRQWWLIKSRYEAIPSGKYPLPQSVAGVQGRIVHAAIEALLNARRERSEATFNARQFAKRFLHDLIRGELATNPRVDAGRISAAISLDTCLARFFALANTLPAPSNATTRIVSNLYRESSPPSYAAEVWLEVDDPPLVAQIDNVIDGAITDFKTGQFIERHRHQITLYALIWWLRFGVPPRRMLLNYVSEELEIEVPSETNLAEIADQLRSELDGIRQALVSPPPPAQPSVEACRYCPVRQLCDDYWTSPATVPLRAAQNPVDPSASQQPVFRDVCVSRLPSHWSSGQALSGKVEAADVGPITLSIGERFVPGQTEPTPTACRLLNVMLVYSDNSWTVNLTSASEVFWC